jgi:hypothetical protein
MQSPLTVDILLSLSACCATSHHLPPPPHPHTVCTVLTEPVFQDFKRLYDYVHKETPGVKRLKTAHLATLKYISFKCILNQNTAYILTADHNFHNFFFLYKYSFVQLTEGLRQLRKCD